MWFFGRTRKTFTLSGFSPLFYICDYNTGYSVYLQYEPFSYNVYLSPPPPPSQINGASGGGGGGVGGWGGGEGDCKILCCTSSVTVQHPGSSQVGLNFSMNWRVIEDLKFFGLVKNSQIGVFAIYGKILLAYSPLTFIFFKRILLACFNYFWR
jgi:hypothetical protein